MRDFDILNYFRSKFWVSSKLTIMFKTQILVLGGRHVWYLFPKENKLSLIRDV